jgi:hypothetical protein
MNVKYHLSQETINQFTVVIASKIINQKEVKEVVEDSEVEVQVAMEETTAAVDDLEEIDHLEKCTKQLVETAVMNVKYHLSQETINQFTVVIASKIINQKEVKEVVEDSEVEVAAEAAMEETTAVVDDLEEIDHLEKCTKQLVETVAMNVKYHLSQETINQFTVVIALKIIDKTTFN